MTMTTSDCAVASHGYLLDQGWSTTTYGSAVWTSAGVTVEAIDVPRPVGERTLEVLRAHGQDGPVIRNPGRPERWIFLTEPSEHAFTEQLAGLAERGGHCMRLGYRIDLPPTRVPGGELSWIQEPLPDGRPLAKFGLVAYIAAAVRLSEEDGC